VAQYIILIIAYLTPVVWLGVKHTGIPIPQFAYGVTLQKIGVLEKKITADPKEKEARALAKAAADEAKAAPKDIVKATAARRELLEKKLAEAKASNQPDYVVKSAQDALGYWPTDPQKAAGFFAGRANLAANANPPRPHAEPFPGATEQARDIARRNFLGIVFCMMFGTAALPHILMRYYTTPSVRQARMSVFWSLFFIFLLYFTAPTLAVLAKFDVYSNLVGSHYADLPAWAAAWRLVDPTLLTITDLNFDGIVQLAEIAIGGDIIVLATPEIAGLPYVVSGLVAAGGLAAALSTADGLLLTIANALGHDLYYKMIAPTAPTARRVTVSKLLLLIVAFVAAWVTSYKPGNILFLVGAAFSLAASAFFPALVLGVFWKRANKWGAITGMVAGLGVCWYYMSTTYPFLRDLFGVTAPIASYTWFGMNAISAGVFGVPIGLATIWIVSLLTRAPSAEVQDLVDHVRYPVLTGDVETRAA
jgi:cation/acetate symporter